jgi:hypothetical protein
MYLLLNRSYSLGHFIAATRPLPYFYKCLSCIGPLQVARWGAYITFHIYEIDTLI